MRLCIHLHRRTIVLLLLSVLLSTISSSCVTGQCRVELPYDVVLEICRQLISKLRGKLRENMPVQHFLDAIRHNTDPAFTRR